MYLYFQRLLTDRVRHFLQQQYGLDLPTIVIEQPPKVEFGEYALPLSFELAKRLRKAPRKIAEEIVASLGKVAGFDRLEVAGAGYINARLSRAEAATALIKSDSTSAVAERPKILVEHSSINPNKAAHIGHLRNAILGDTFVRLLRFNGYPVDVQNYIDNTGVQVADVVVGFRELERKSKKDIEALISAATFRLHLLGCLCRRLFLVRGRQEEPAEARRDLTRDRRRQQRDCRDCRADLHRRSPPPPRDHGPALHRVRLPAARKRNPAPAFLGSRLPAYEGQGRALSRDRRQERRLLGDEAPVRPLTKKPEEMTDDDTKVIVRSNGTVGYVGKDIAYHLWKFGLLGRDFGYRKFFRYPTGPAVLDLRHRWRDRASALR